MLVCHCYGVPESRIRAAVRSGARTSRDVRRRCSAGGGCGGCRRAVADILRDELALTRSEERDAVEPEATAAG